MCGRRNMNARGFAAKLFLAVAILALFCFTASYLYSFVGDRGDNMLDLIAGRPHPPLMRLDLDLGVGPGGPENKRRFFSIQDPSSISYINTKKFGGEKDLEDYVSGALWPIHATFVFADGSSYKAEVEVPNRRGHLWITYPINPWSFDALDDKRYILDLDPNDAKNIEIFFEGLGAYKNEMRPTGKKKT
jgi:hypothetical protein